MTVKSKLIQLAMVLGITNIFIFAAPQVTAHHSTTVYDYTISKVVTGTVNKFRWTQPHSFILIDVPTGEGGTERWNVEVGTPSINARMGWKKSDINADDIITITVHPVRTGKPHGAASRVELADGRVLFTPSSALAGSIPFNTPEVRATPNSPADQ